MSNLQKRKKKKNKRKKKKKGKRKRLTQDHSEPASKYNLHSMDPERLPTSALSLGSRSIIHRP